VAVWSPDPHGVVISEQAGAWYPLNYRGLKSSCRSMGGGNRENNGKMSRFLTMRALLDDRELLLQGTIGVKQVFDLFVIRAVNVIVLVLLIV
jgi:hypothetical protein